MDNTTYIIVFTILFALVIFLEILTTKSKWVIVSDDLDNKLLSRQYFYTCKRAAYYAYKYNFKNYKIIKIC